MKGWKVHSPHHQAEKSRGHAQNQCPWKFTTPMAVRKGVNTLKRFSNLPQSALDRYYYFRHFFLMR